LHEDWLFAAGKFRFIKTIKGVLSGLAAIDVASFLGGIVSFNGTYTKE